MRRLRRIEPGNGHLRHRPALRAGIHRAGHGHIGIDGGRTVCFASQLFGLHAFRIQTIGVGFFDDAVLARPQKLEFCRRQLRSELVDERLFFARGNFLSEFVDFADKRIGVVGTAVGILCEQPIDDVIAQIGGDIVWQRRRGRLNVHEDRRQESIFFEGRTPGEHFVEHDAQGIEIASGIEFFAARLFGTHVFGGAGRCADFREPAFVVFVALFEFCDAEIEYFDKIQFCQENIVGF